MLDYESFDLLKTHSLSTQNLVQIFIDSYIIMTMGKVHQMQNYALY